MDTATSRLANEDGNNRAMPLSKFGLHCVRHTMSDTCVVFVHGILSGGDSAWGSPSWPELLKLEPEFQHVRIFVFTYRTSLTSRTYSIADAADALREHFSIDGLWNVPNIVFVCHSMGGIVVRRFLVANQSKLSDLRPTIGLFLVASPSLGSRDANILSTLSFALQHTQAAALRFSQANTSLDELHRDFRTLLSGRKLCIVGRELLEDRPIKVKRLLGLWRQVVEPFSASAYFHQPGFEPLRIPDSDHVTIVKPLSPDALQHVALKRFLTELPPWANANCAGHLGRQSPRFDEETAKAMPTIEFADDKTRGDSGTDTLPKAQATSLDMIAQYAIAPERRGSAELPHDNATPEAVYEVAIKLRAGRMLERILASTLVKRSLDPLAVFKCALERDVTEGQVEAIAPWLRFSAKDPGAGIESIAEILSKKLKLDDVRATRMKANLMGWSGSFYLRDVDWKDRYRREKYSFCYAEAYLHAAWRDQGENSLRYIVGSAIDMNAYYKSIYDRDFSYFDVLSAVKGIPASNSKIMLNEMVKRTAPPGMIRGLLYRMCITPTVDAVPDLRKLLDYADPEVAEAARLALAFVPARSDTVRGLKRSFKGAPFTVAAGVDLQTDAVDKLGEMLSLSSNNNTPYNAAWALVRMSKLSPTAKRYVRKAAFENRDAIVRSICLIGLAIGASREAEAHVVEEYASARDVEKFCLSIALAYTSDAREMLSHLANTSEDRLYVPFLETSLQMLFRGAMKRAAVNSPILHEMLTLTDDN